MNNIRRVTTSYYQFMDLTMDSVKYIGGIALTVILAFIAELSITKTPIRMHIENKLLLGKGI